MRTPASYSITEVSINQISALDLKEEIAKQPNEPVEIYRGGFEDEDENALSGSVDALFFPNLGRAGIAWGANAVWTDATDIEDAFTRYINDDLAE